MSSLSGAFNNAPYVPRCFPFLTKLPDLSRVSLPSIGKEIFLSALREVIELERPTIDGLPKGFDLIDNKVVDKVSRGFVFGYSERYGQVISNFYRELAVMTSQGMGGFEITFIEPDPSMSCVVAAWKASDISLTQFIQPAGGRGVQVVDGVYAVTASFSSVITTDQLLMEEAALILRAATTGFTGPFSNVH